jgi:Zn-dependent peptidase ImmA (M78 family)
MDLDSPALDAFSTFLSKLDKTPYVILGADKQSAVRSRFDVGHELGHIILHKSLEANRLKNSVEFKTIEQQADRFSSAFLVPGDRFADDFTVPSLNAFQTLKYKWLVSIGVLIRRTLDLGFISDEYYRKLWINYNQRGWRKEEPLDDQLAIEQPLLLPRACKLIIESKVRSAEQLLAEIPLSPKDVEELMCLPNGYLNPLLPRIELRGGRLNKSDYKDAIEAAERIIKGMSE